MTSPDPNIGRLLDNRYELIALIGKGAMGRVYLARHALLGGSVAVKFLSQTLLNDKMRDRFFQEARTCAQLGQKTIHIVRVTDFGVDENDVPFYVMEYLQGESLSEIIQPKPLALPRFLNMAHQICLGLKYAHEGIEVEGQIWPIIHRDVKPSNILVSPDETTGELVKILDFGISQLQSESVETKTFMGTLAYASPEQMEGKEIDNRSDLYSLGVMMFQMLTGRLPLQPETHSFGAWYKAHHFQTPRPIDAVAPHLKLPKALDHLIISCLSKSPSDRPHSAQELLEHLEHLDERFRKGRQLGQRIKDTLSNVATREPGSSFTNQSLTQPDGENRTTEVSAPDALCRLQSWPPDKPVARITFPQIIATSQRPLATLWVMLPQEEISQMRVSRLYNQVYRNFLCTLSPHPMAMWLTAVYNPFCHGSEGPRWLYSFLDLKTSAGLEILQVLGTEEEYRILMFAIENPRRCAHVLPARINESLAGQLQRWAVTARTTLSVGSATMSKDLLRAEFEKLKPSIYQRMMNRSKQDTDSLGMSG
jgi:serine/threonine-protein kinase